MDLTTGLIIFGIVLAISLIVRIFFAITKILVTILIIAALVIGGFVFCKSKFAPPAAAYYVSNSGYEAAFISL
ncbi:hypothetical protein KID03_01215 [bacterium]|uniref:Uncharacterized protein n=1 Tax=Candidatus Scatenecus faecavium TaxID=2840915 RepID=A0A9D1FVG6_9BACT|nr:hypothetical protein [bacterium]HIS82678.1 hypothetical protein [Candidatus Scatenecus faecavium]